MQSLPVSPPPMTTTCNSFEGLSVSYAFSSLWNISVCH